MRKRLWVACIGALVGFSLALLIWLVGFVVAGETHHLVGLTVGFATGFGILSFLFPPRMADSFVQFVLGMLENANI